MLTERMFETFTGMGAEWVLWLLLGLSVVSVMLIVERVLFFARHGMANAGEVAGLLAAGKLEEARALVPARGGMEARVVLAALEAAPRGPRSVEEVIASGIAGERGAYERFLAFLGTLGNNAPFIGLFGTVIGIIQAFADLSVAGDAAATGAGTVMAGISEALVATAVGIFVAIPAVVAFNAFNRQLKSVVARTQSLGHALLSHLQAA